MPVGLYNQPQAHNPYPAAYENPYATYGQPNAASKNVYANSPNSGQQASPVSISEQGQRLAQSDKSTIQTIEPKVLSSKERAALYEQKKLEASHKSGLASCLETVGTQIRMGIINPCGVYSRRYDEMVKAIEKEMKADPPCQTFELSVKKTSMQQTIVLHGLSGLSQFSFLHNDFSEYYHRYGDSSTLKIQEVAWQYTDYTNDAEQQNVELLYGEPYTRQTVDRKNVVGISKDPVGETPKFNHLKFGPGANLEIEHKLTGGDYPAKAPNTPATINVKYQYQTKSCPRSAINYNYGYKNEL